jgi:DNA-binding transcriptional LysR family regulator
MDLTNQFIRRLSRRDLRMFTTVVEQGNLAKAATRLSISRPVVSKSISHLERTLGVRLLDRSPQGVELTAFGRALLKRSVVVFDELRQSVREIKFLADPTAGELRIGASEYMAAGLVPAIIDRLSRTNPNLQFKLALADAIERLRERDVEFVITRLLSQELDGDLDAEPLFHEKVFVAASPSNKWVRRRRVQLEDLVREPWILAPPKIVEGSPIVEAFRAKGLTMPQTTVLGLSLPLRNGLLAAGRFLTIVPGSVLKFGAERTLLKTLPVALPAWRLPVAIITLKNRTLSPLANLFIEQVREFAKPLAGRKHSRQGNRR